MHSQTKICSHAFGAMKKVMEYSTNGKVTNEQKTLIQKTIMGLLAGFPKFQANQKVNLHAKAVGEAINAVFWVINVKKKIKKEEISLFFFFNFSRKLQKCSSRIALSHLSSMLWSWEALSIYSGGSLILLIFFYLNKFKKASNFEFFSIFPFFLIKNYWQFLECNLTSSGMMLWSSPSRICQVF